MTALDFWLSEEAIYVIADTLVTNTNYNAAFFTTKVLAAPHLNGLICGTGNLDFILDWQRYVLGRMLAIDLVHLDEFTSENLQKIYSTQSNEVRDNSTSTIYHLGFDESEDKFVGFAYRSTNNFASEKLGYGLSIKPAYEIDMANITEFPKDFVKLCLEQRIAQDKLPLKEKVFIGGHLIAFMLQKAKKDGQFSEVSMSISRPHEFDDLNDDYLTCLAQLGS